MSKHELDSEIRSLAAKVPFALSVASEHSVMCFLILGYMGTESP